MTLSRWCADQWTSLVTIWDGADGEEWQPQQIAVTGHQWCVSQRDHDRDHVEAGCCGQREEEKESWACTCDCHANSTGRRRT